MCTIPFRREYLYFLLVSLYPLLSPTFAFVVFLIILLCIFQEGVCVVIYLFMNVPPGDPSEPFTNREKWSVLKHSCLVLTASLSAFVVCAFQCVLATSF